MKNQFGHGVESGCRITAEAGIVMELGLGRED
jgi:hypothetical protein